MRRRAHRVAAALAVAALAVLAAGCSSTSRRAATAPRPDTHDDDRRQDDHDDRARRAGRHVVQAPSTSQPGTDLSVVSCPSPGVCLIGSTTGQTYRLFLDKVTALGPPRAVPFAAGRVLPFVRRRELLRGRAQPEPGRPLQRVGVAGARRPCRRPGHHRHRLHRAPPSASPSTARATPSTTTAAAGPATSVPGAPPTRSRACRRPSASPPRAAPRSGTAAPGPSPTDADTQGQLNSVSCASTTFCVLVDSSGDVLTWNGQDFSRARLHCHRTARLRDQRLWADVGVVPDRRPSAAPSTPWVGSSAGTERRGAPAPSSTTGTR